MITNEQIEAEITELVAQADRKISSVKTIFAEAARLRAQAECLRKVIALRITSNHHTPLTSVTLLGFAEDEQAEPAAFCAVTWPGAQTEVSGLQIFLRIGWETLLSDNTLSYFSDLLNDWKELMRTHPELVPAMIREISVGPIRTLEEATLAQDKVAEVLKRRMGEVVRFPPAVRIK
ncbi:MAG TPA: hypothetical protein VMI06_08400 [Terriglobia bacterium]|nr:hypothetical protein [Terriglobia bacterium]